MITDPMRNLLLYVTYGLSVILGGIFGYRLSSIDNLETFKVLNVIGLFYDIAGLIILSHLLSQNEKFQRFIANIFSELLIRVHLGIPIGLVLVCLFFPGLDNFPSSSIVMNIGVSGLLWMLVPVFIVEDIVIGAKTKWFQTAQSRSKFLGGFLLISGLFIQFVAALKDLGI